MNDLISIIVPVYNVKPYLKKCVDSILSQSYKNIELILVDDGSTDGSSVICDYYLNKDSRVKVFHKTNGGVSSARNFGISYAKGKYIGFVDGDDYIEKNMFEVLYMNMINYDADLSMCNYNIIKKLHTTYHKHNDIANNILFIKDKKTFFSLLNKNYYQGFLCNKLFVLEKFKKLKLNENIHVCEDLLLVCQYAEICNNFCFDNRLLYNYFIRNNSATNHINSKTITVLDAYDKIIAIVEKYNNEDIIFYKYSKLLWMNKIINEFKFKRNDDLYNEFMSLYKEIINSKYISIKSKIVLFIKIRLYYLYKTVNIIYHKIGI